MWQKMTVLAVAAVALSLSVSHAQANASIGVAFGASLSSTDQPGVVGGGNWNVVSGAIGSKSGLLDNSGAATSMAISWSASFAYGGYHAPHTGNAATNALYSIGIGGDPTYSHANPAFTISGISFSDYEVIVYESQDTGAPNVLSTSDGSTTYYYRSNGQTNNTAGNLLLTTSTNPASPTSGPAQFQEFTNLSGSSVTITTSGSISGTLSTNLFGVQIVDESTPSSVPEPASLAILMTGALAVRSFRRTRDSVRV